MNRGREMASQEKQQNQKPKNNYRVLLRVFEYMFKDYKWMFIGVVCFIIITALCTLRTTLFMQTLIDDYIVPMMKSGTTDFTKLQDAIINLGITCALGVLTSFAYNRMMVYICQGTLKKLREALFTRMESLPIRYFDTHPHGDIMSVYTNDIDTLRQLLSQSIPQIVNSGVTLLITLVSMFALDVWMTLLSLAMVGVMALLVRRFGSRSGRYFVEQQKDLGKLNGYIEEMMDGQKVVKVFNHEEKSIEGFDKLNEQLRISSANANTNANTMMPVIANVGNISYVLCAIVGGIIAISGFTKLTIGTLITFLTLNKSFTQPITQVAQQMNAIVMAMAGAQRIFNLLDEKPETDEGYVELVNAHYGKNGELEETDKRTNMWAWKHPHKADGTITYERMRGDIVFEDVDFGYTDDKMVLHDITMYAEPGQKIAFVGSTGAGKTTITNLINRFYDIQDGKIRYDGINIEKIKKNDLRRSLGIVLQDTHLFTGTVMDNIRYGNLEATDEECIAAAKLANANSFIERLPQGYNTVLTGDGANLSQGQRQLLAIARAAVADPPVLILDEATSSIDTRTERLVQEGMDRLMAGRTSFVIAHRLSTVKNSDCIMVLEQGRIIERGSHDDLIEQKGRYYQLYTGNAIPA